MGCLCFKSWSSRFNDPISSFIECDLSVNYGTADTTELVVDGQESPPMEGECVDICGLKHTKFIIQSGTHYIKADSLNDEVSISDVKSLREVCKNGDHYLAQYNAKTNSAGSSSRLIKPSCEKQFYIIKGKLCIAIKSLSSTSKCSERTFDLHPDCQGGSFYCANREGFYIIRSKDNTCLHVQDMSEEGYQHSDAIRYDLHTAFADGLHYFATDYYFYVLKEHAKYGLVYHRTKDLRSNEERDICAVSPSITSLMPLSSLDRQPKQAAASEMECQAHQLKSQPSHLIPARNAYAPMPRYAKPTSDNLTVIKWKNKKGRVQAFRLKTLILHKWRDIGTFIDVPWQHLDDWAEQMDEKACCEAVLSHWLEHPPLHYPATWDGLYQLLKDSDLGQVAASLKKAVKNAI